jgi:hypothetical protein
LSSEQIDLEFFLSELKSPTNVLMEALFVMEAGWLVVKASESS